MTPVPSRGEVWWVEPADVGRRPMVVLTRDAAIGPMGRAVVAPCTTNVRGLPTEVLLEPGEDPVPQVSVVSLDSVLNVPLGVLVERLGRLSDDRMRQICAALAAAVDCSA
jgi:mRNA interferase MazF